MKYILLLISFSLLLAGCSSTPKLAEQHSGFLPDYKILKPVPNTPKNIQILRYSDPSIAPGTYRALIIKPVTLYQTVTKDGIKKSQIMQARKEIQNGIKQIAGQRMSIVTTPGPRVAELKISISGAALEGEGFKLRNLMPISMALKVASTATGVNNKQAAMMVELKFTDSVSGKMIREVVTVIKGEEFRDKAHTAKEFDMLAKAWVKMALKYSAGH